MCLAVPGKITEFIDNSNPKLAKVSFNGLIRKVCIEWIPEVIIGDYVIVHAGFAINRLNEEEALETLKLFEEMEEALSLEEKSNPKRE